MFDFSKLFSPEIIKHSNTTWSLGIRKPTNPHPPQYSLMIDTRPALVHP